jgi:hypothetical protein
LTEQFGYDLAWVALQYPGGRPYFLAFSPAGCVFGTDLGSGFSRTLGDSGRQPARQSSFSRGISVVPDRLTGVFIKSAGEPRNGVSLDQKEGSAVAGWIGGDEFGAHAHVARHARNCAEWRRTQDVAHRKLGADGLARRSCFVSPAWRTGPPPIHSSWTDTRRNRMARPASRSSLQGAACGFWSGASGPTRAH